MSTHVSRKRKLSMVSLTALFVGYSAAAQIRQEEAHEHGRSVINVAIEGRIVAVEIRGPMANFLGFEHEPSNDQERMELADALARLERPVQFLNFDANAGCSMRSAESMLESESHEEEESHDDDDGSHEESHDEEQHLEIAAAYEFECASPERLSTLRVGLFGLFPSTEVIEANVLGPSAATRHELTPQSTELSLR